MTFRKVKVLISKTKRDTNFSVQPMQVTRTTIISRMGSNFDRPLTVELAALERLKKKTNMILCIGHSSAFNFDRIFFILCSNKDSHNISDEFEFQPDPTLDCRVICPLCEKSIFSVVATLAPSSLLGSSLFFEVTRTSVTSRMSSNLTRSDL